jgi:hypothetical protein
MTTEEIVRIVDEVMESRSGIPWASIVTTVLSVAFSVLGIVWYLSARLQRTDGALDLVNLKLDGMKNEAGSAKDSRRELWSKHNELAERVKQREVVCGMTHQRKQQGGTGG